MTSWLRVIVVQLLRDVRELCSTGLQSVTEDLELQIQGSE